MNIVTYQQCLEQLIKEAFANTDGSNQGISEYLWSKQKPGVLSRNRLEKQKALDEARRAFDEHRHWPVDIVITHLGLDRNILLKKK